VGWECNRDSGGKKIVLTAAEADCLKTVVTFGTDLPISDPHNSFSDSVITTTTTTTTKRLLTALKSR